MRKQNGEEWGKGGGGGMVREGKGRRKRSINLKDRREREKLNDVKS